MVEGARLESVFRGNSNVGSNPTLSATIKSISYGRSGTNQFHGGLFDFVRNSRLDAKNYFDKSKPAFRMNQFGGTFGGPLSWSKQPSTFFFADYQGTRLAQGLTYISTVPTAAERAGNFSGFLTVYDPTTQLQTASGAYSRSPLPGNAIPAGLLDRVGAKLMNLYPLQNIAGTSNNYLYSPLRTDNGDEFDIKLDHRFSSNDNGFARYSRARDNVYQPGTLPAPAVGGAISGLTRQPSEQAVLSENHIFSPTVVNSARAGFSRIAVTSTDANAGQALATDLGIPGSNVAGNPLTDGLPRITVTGASSLGSFGNLPALIVSNNFQYDDSISLTRGRHTIQVGAEVQRRQYNVFQTANLRGTLNFTTAYSSNPGLSAASGLGLADLLLGRAASGSLQFLDGTRGLRQTEIAGFFQDDFRATKKLTLNLGVRYENYLGWPWTEVDNRLYVFTSPTGVTQAGTNGVPRSGVYGNNLNFVPRIGAAYQVGSKTVIRAAYGIFFSAPQVPIALDATANPPEMISTAFTNNQYDFADARPLSQGFSHPATGAVAGSALYHVDPHASLPYTEQWNFTLQHQVTPSTLLSAAYVGTKGTHLLAQNDINQPVPGATAIASRRPYPAFQSIVDNETIDTSSYHALQLTGERRLSKNLSFQLTYTWSHALDYASSNPGTGGALFVDSYDHRIDRGNADFNLPQRFVGSFVYQLPFHATGFRKHVVEGWELNGILSLYSGLPFSVQAASNTLNIGTGSRAEYIGPGDGSLPAGERTVQRWFNPAAFSTPPLQQFGNVGRNTLQGPATRQLDFSAFKTFSLHESKQNLQLRAEAFNLSNTPQLNTPNATIGAAGAGSITSAGSPFTFQRLSREVQLALKFNF